jgi:hypothetical protein
VQILPGDAAVALHLQPAGHLVQKQCSETISASGPGQHTSACRLRIHFHKQTSQIRETKSRKSGIAPSNYRAKITYAGSVPNEVRWKNLLRHLVAETKSSAACRKFALKKFALNLCPAFHMLELAKGFEPPTP